MNDPQTHSTPPARKPRRWLRRTVIAVVALIALIIGINVASSGGNHTTKTPAAAPSSTSAAPAAPAASTPATAPLTGPVGTTYTVTDSGVTYGVVLVKVDQQATSTNQFDAPAAGKHLVAAEFSITGKTGTATSDANNNAVVVGSDGQDYTYTSVAGLTDGTNFNYGMWTVTPGQHLTGWVSFTLPDGVSVASVQWTHGFGGDTATWTV